MDAFEAAMLDRHHRWWKAGSMSRGAHAIMAALDKLPPAEREEVVSELLRRIALSEHAAPADDELTAAADEVFRAIDRRERYSR